MMRNVINDWFCDCTQWQIRKCQSFYPGCYAHHRTAERREEDKGSLARSRNAVAAQNPLSRGMRADRRRG